ncbi:MAG: ribonuclease P protein component [Chitinophagales bacterium]
MANTYVSLKKKSDFQKTYKGKKLWGRFYVAYVLNNGLPFNRYALVASSKVGNAVVRNKLKRRSREIIRQKKDSVNTGFDVILVLRKVAVDAQFGQMVLDINNLFNKAGLF